MHPIACLYNLIVSAYYAECFPSSFLVPCWLAIFLVCGWKFFAPRFLLFISSFNLRIKCCLQIYGIIEDLRRAKFHLESSEVEAGKVVLALIRRGIPASDCIENSELEALRLAASSLKITSRLALLAEKRSIKRLLDKVRQTGLPKETILMCLLSLSCVLSSSLGRVEFKTNGC